MVEKREEEHLEKDAACNETHWNERMGDDDSEEDENDEDEEEDGGEDDSEDFSSDEFSDEDDEEERRVLREKFGVQAEEDHDERHEDVRHGAQRHGTHEPSLSEETADEDANEGRPQVPNGGPVASMKGMVKEGMKWMQNLDLGVSDATIEWHAQAIDQQRLPGTPNMPLPVDEVAFRERLVASMKLGSRDQVCTYHVEHGLMVDRVDGQDECRVYVGAVKQAASPFAVLHVLLDHVEARGQEAKKALVACRTKTDDGVKDEMRALGGIVRELNAKMNVG